MDDLEVQLATSWVEDEDGTIDGLSCQVTFIGLVDCDSVDVGIINEPDDLVTEELLIVLRVEIGLSRFRGIELETLSNSLSQDIKGRIGFHNLVHGLLHQGLDTWEPVTEGTMEVVSEINSNEATSRGRIDREIIGGVVQEFGSGISLDIM